KAAASGKMPHPRLKSAMHNLRLQIFRDRRDAPGCRQTAERWEKLGRTDAASLYDAACFRAVTAGLLADDPPAASAEADRAMDWLRKAVAAGYRNHAQLASDEDLAALRGRADFRALVRSMPAVAPPPRPKG